MLIAALFVIVKNLEQPINRYINKHIHTMEYYSAIKRNELSIHETTWMKKEYILHDSIYLKYEKNAN